MRRNTVTNCTKDGEMARRWNKVKKGVKLVISMALVLTIALINPVNLIPHGTAPEEQEYLSEYKEIIAEGEVSERERRFLEKLRKANGISEERAAEIEHLSNLIK